MRRFLATMLAGVVAVALFGAAYWLLWCGDDTKAKNRSDVTVRALEWRGMHAPGSRMHCVNFAPCDNWSKCTASWPDAHVVVPFECTPDGCYAVAK